MKISMYCDLALLKPCPAVLAGTAVKVIFISPKLLPTGVKRNRAPLFACTSPVSFAAPSVPAPTYQGSRLLSATQSYVSAGAKQSNVQKPGLTSGWYFVDISCKSTFHILLPDLTSIAEIGLFSIAVTGTPGRQRICFGDTFAII